MYLEILRVKLFFENCAKSKQEEQKIREGALVINNDIFSHNISESVICILKHTSTVPLYLLHLIFFLRNLICYLDHLYIELYT